MSLRIFKRNIFVKFKTEKSLVKRSNLFLFSCNNSEACFSTIFNAKETSSELSDKGGKAFASKNYEQALKYYLQAKETYISPVVLLNIAKCYEYLNDQKGAFHEYRTIIRFFENSLDDKTRELTQFQECYVEALIGAGNNNYLHDNGKTLEYWTKASKFTNIPKHVLGNYLIAGLYNRMGNHREAIRYYTESIHELQERNEYSQILNESFNYFYRGLSYTSIGEVEQAIQDFTKIINEYRDGSNVDSILNDNHNRSMAFMNRGLCFCTLNDFELGFKDLEESLKESDHDIGIIYSVAQAYNVRYIETSSIQYKEKAIQLFKKILEIDPTHNKSQQFLTELYRK